MNAFRFVRIVRGHCISEEIDGSEDERAEGHDVAGALELEFGVQEASQDGRKDAAKRVGEVVDG